MRVAVNLNSRQEGDAVKRSLDDPTTRVAMLVNGLLLELPLSARRAVITFVIATVDAEERIAAPAPSPLRLRDGTSGD